MKDRHDMKSVKKIALLEMLQLDEEVDVGVGSSVESVDEQIDAYLISFETASKSDDETGAPVKEWNMRRLIEAPDDDAPSGKLDAGRFASKVSRLIKNFDTLLSVDVVIGNRALAYIEKHYGADAADDVRESMRFDYGIDLWDDEQKNKAPSAVGAGGDVLPGGGGGGI